VAKQSTGRILLYNLIAAIVTAGIVLGGTYSWLSSYTHHGESISVPNVKGMSLAKTERFLGEKNLEFKVVDSLFVLGHKPGEVLEQDPAPDSKVKEGRTIYLTVNASRPPKVKMPNLVDVSLRQAEAILQSFGLKVGRTSYQPDLAKNAVLEQQYKGRSIRPGTEIDKGSVIDLVLGDGVGNAEVLVPDLIGLTRGEALFALKGSSLNLGTLHVDPGVRDTNNAKVYRQIPEADGSTTLRLGEAVDLYLR
jgi:beta-lactam-binding protein with PASTA domain